MVENSAPRYNTTLERKRSNNTIIKVSWIAKGPNKELLFKLSLTKIALKTAIMVENISS